MNYTIEYGHNNKTMNLTNDKQTTTTAGPTFLSLRALFDLLVPIKDRLITACILEAIAAVTSVVPFIAVAKLAQVLLAPGPINTQLAWYSGWTALVALAIRILFSYTAYLITHYADNDFQLHIRRQIANRLVHTPLGWFTNRSAGAVKKGVADDVMAMHTLVAHAGLELVSGVVVPVVTLVYLFSISWQMTLISLVPLVIGLLLYARLMRGGIKHMAEYSNAMESINSSAIEFVQGISVVKTFGQTGRAHKRFLDSADHFLALMWNMMTGSIRSTSVAEVVFAPLTAVLLIASAATFMVLQGWESAFVLVPFTLLGLGMTAPISALFYSGVALQQAAAAAGRVQALLSTPILEEGKSKEQINGLKLELRAVSFSYDKRTEALKNINIILEPGTTTALVGRSGSGKTTIAKLIPRFWDPDQGSILLGGVDIRELPSDVLYRHVSFVFQDVQLLRTTVRDNIAIAKKNATEQQLIMVAQAANIHERILQLPRGYDSVIGDDALFSGGEAQRLSIARALLADTPILVLDEATAFADPESEALIQDALSTLSKGRTLLVIAHRLSTIQHADQIIVLDRGRIIERGTHSKLLENEGRYFSLWRDNERSAAWHPSTHAQVNESGNYASTLTHVIYV